MWRGGGKGLRASFPNTTTGTRSRSSKTRPLGSSGVHQVKRGAAATAWLRKMGPPPGQEEKLSAKVSSIHYLLIGIISTKNLFTSAAAVAGSG